jgi:hypothetical protein
MIVTTLMMVGSAIVPTKTLQKEKEIQSYNMLRLISSQHLPPILPYVQWTIRAHIQQGTKITLECVSNARPILL